MFLPDRFIKGECPNCHAKDQYGDTCEVCSAVYSPTDLINPYSALIGRDAGAARPASTSSSSCPIPRCVEFLQDWTHTTGRLQPEVAEQDPASGSRPTSRRRPGRLGHQPRRALLRHRDPRCAGQVLLRLARRAGRLPRLAEELLRARRGIDFDALLADPSGCEQVPLHRQGHHLLPHAVLAGDAALQRPQDAATRSSCTASSPSAARR